EKGTVRATLGFSKEDGDPSLEILDNSGAIRGKFGLEAGFRSVCRLISDQDQGFAELKVARLGEMQSQLNLGGPGDAFVTLLTEEEPKLAVVKVGAGLGSEISLASGPDSNSVSISKVNTDEYIGMATGTKAPSPEFYMSTREGKELYSGPRKLD